MREKAGDPFSRRFQRLSGQSLEELCLESGESALCVVVLFVLHGRLACESIQHHLVLDVAFENAYNTQDVGCNIIVTHAHTHARVWTLPCMRSMTTSRQVGCARGDTFGNESRQASPF